jgi:hypothetical protein
MIVMLECTPARWRRKMERPSRLGRPFCFLSIETSRASTIEQYGGYPSGWPFFCYREASREWLLSVFVVIFVLPVVFDHFFKAGHLKIH